MCPFVKIPFWKQFFLYSIRVLLDRTSSDLDRALRHLDPDMFYPSSDSRVPDLPVHTNTNSHTFSTSSPQCSLAQILSDIKACRWKFFRPRPVQENSRGEDKKGIPHVEKSGVSPLSNGVSGEGFILLSQKGFWSLLSLQNVAFATLSRLHWLLCWFSKKLW